MISLLIQTELGPGAGRCSPGHAPTAAATRSKTTLALPRAASLLVTDKSLHREDPSWNNGSGGRLAARLHAAAALRASGRGEATAPGQQHPWGPQVLLHAPGRVCPFIQGRLRVPNLVRVQSCTAHEAPSHTLPALTAHRGSTAHIRHRHRDAGKDSSSGSGGLLPS